MGRIASRPYALDADQERQFALVPPNTLRLRQEHPGALRVGFRQITRGVLDVSPTASWSVDVIAYEYRLLDHSERELLVYHWHPEAAGPDFPHIHVSATLNAQVDAMTRREIALDKRHVVTGLVELREFVRMLVTEFDVRPLRPDWQLRLATSTR